jgi:hypothetical protein
VHFSVCFSVPGDYLELVDATLTIPAGSLQDTQSCGEVQVVGDEIREADETFMVQITPQNINDVVTTVTFRVVIQDDGDSKHCMGRGCGWYARVGSRVGPS